MEKTYKKILFDLDDTLVDDTENRKYAIKQILLDRREEVTDEKIEEFLKLDNQFWKDRAAGKIKDPYEFKDNIEKASWVRAQRFLKYFKGIELEEAMKINEKYLLYLEEHVVPIENSIQILKYLYEQNYDIYIITNGPEKAAENKLEKLGANPYIVKMYSAEEFGYMKPHREFFDAFFNRIGNNFTREMLIIGDELDKDVAGGIQNNIDSCWFNPKKLVNETECVPTYEINNLMELKGILKGRKQEWTR